MHKFELEYKLITDRNAGEAVFIPKKTWQEESFQPLLIESSFLWNRLTLINESQKLILSELNNSSNN